MIKESFKVFSSLDSNYHVICGSYNKLSRLLRCNAAQVKPRVILFTLSKTRDFMTDVTVLGKYKFDTPVMYLCAKSAIRCGDIIWTF